MIQTPKIRRRKDRQIWIHKSKAFKTLKWAQPLQVRKADSEPPPKQSFSQRKKCVFKKYMSQNKEVFSFQSLARGGRKFLLTLSKCSLLISGAFRLVWEIYVETGHTHLLWQCRVGCRISVYFELGVAMKPALPTELHLQKLGAWLIC